jgi:hypothetical protein
MHGCPSPITPSDVEKQLLEKGIQVYSAERFVVGNSDIPRAIRISLISEHNLEVYRSGLRIVHEFFHTL